jgi:hypothetical protein
MSGQRLWVDLGLVCHQSVLKDSVEVGLESQQRCGASTLCGLGNHRLGIRVLLAAKSLRIVFETPCSSVD